MVKLTSVILAAVFASIAVGEELVSCGDQPYYPSQYTCFDDQFLCPIISGERYLRCGADCYSVSEYSCVGTTLNLRDTEGPEDIETCGSASFYPSKVTRASHARESVFN